MDDKAIVKGEDWNRLFDDFLSTLNDRITLLEIRVKDLEDKHE